MSDAQPETSTETEVTIRRAPKVGVFLILGGALGAVVTLVLTLLQPDEDKIGYATLLGYFLLFGIPAGVALGALVALILDRVSRRSVRTATAERITVDEPPLEGELLED